MDHGRLPSKLKNQRKTDVKAGHVADVPSQWQILVSDPSVPQTRGHLDTGGR